MFRDKLKLVFIKLAYMQSDRLKDDHPGRDEADHGHLHQAVTKLRRYHLPLGQATGKGGAPTLIFSNALEAELLSNQNPLDPDMVEAHTEALANLFIKEQ